MSNIYIQEPATSGKVILNTTVGLIDIELWAKEAPRACRNFVQLCMEGYYDNTIFHRVLKNFIAQGGDPTGTGNGGESIYSRQGKPWRDEFHSRLRFVRRGLVATADQGSQFFFTLGEARELQGKHSIFGKVAGDTIYNMIRLEQGSRDEEGRPDFPHKILSANIVENPFPDLDEEEFAAKRRAAKALADAQAEKLKKDKKPKGKKDFKLLSFGDEAEAEEVEVTNLAQTRKIKSKSFHDLGDDPKMVSATTVEAVKVKIERVDEEHPGVKQEPKSDDEEEPHRGKTSDIRIKQERESESDEENPKTSSSNVDKPGKKGDKRRSDEKKKERTRLLSSDDDYSATLNAKKGLQSRAKQDKGSRREAETLKLLAKFHEKLRKLPDEEDEDQKEEAVAGKGVGWMGHKLKFDAKDAVLAKDASTKGDDWYEVFDPRNPINKRRREKADQKSESQSKRRR